LLTSQVIFTAFTLDYVLRARTTTTWTWRRKLLVGGLLLASVLIMCARSLAARLIAQHPRRLSQR